MVTENRTYEPLQNLVSRWARLNLKHEVVVRTSDDTFDVFGVGGNTFEERFSVEFWVKLGAVNGSVDETKGLLFDLG